MSVGRSALEKRKLGWKPDVALKSGLFWAAVHTGWFLHVKPLGILRLYLIFPPRLQRGFIAKQNFAKSQSHIVNDQIINICGVLYRATFPKRSTTQIPRSVGFQLGVGYVPRPFDRIVKTSSIGGHPIRLHFCPKGRAGHTVTLYFSVHIFINIWGKIIPFLQQIFPFFRILQTYGKSHRERGTPLELNHRWNK